MGDTVFGFLSGILVCLFVFAILSFINKRHNQPHEPTVVVEYWGPQWDPVEHRKTWKRKREMTRLFKKGRYFIKCEGE